MGTIAKNNPQVASGRPPTASTYQAMYVDTLAYLTADADYLPSASAESIAPRRPRTFSVWLFADLLGKEMGTPSEATCAQTMSLHCGGLLNRDLGHFNLEGTGLNQLLTVMAHSPCDFRSVALSDAADTYDFTQTARTVSDYVLGFGHDDVSDEMATITYADVDYSPRPRKYVDVDVRIDQTATRVARRYNDGDAEVEIEAWGP